MKTAFIALMVGLFTFASVGYTAESTSANKPQVHKSVKVADAKDSKKKKKSTKSNPKKGSTGTPAPQPNDKQAQPAPAVPPQQ